MNDADFLRGCFVSLEVNGEYTAAVLVLRDASRLHFRHGVDERHVESTGAGDAGAVLARIARFRLNRRHLDVQFADGSRWETLFGEPGKRRE